MYRKIALLRGINVGGARKLPMADLKMLFEKLNFSNIQTCIQSGNVVFDVQEDIEHAELAERISKMIKEAYGYEVPVLIRTPGELERVIRENPFINDSIDVSKLFLTFLSEIPGKENKQNAESYNYEPDLFVIIGKEVHIYCEGKYHQSKLSNTFFEKKLGVQATTRNWKTILALLEINRSE